MKKFEILEHISDLKIKVFGENLKELFENAMIGMLESAKYEKNLKSQITKVKIKVKSFDLSSLLVDFLSEILYLVETKKLVFEKINFQKFSDTEIEAELFGKSLKKIGVQIKGVTYHGLEIKKKKDGTLEAIILFDI
jgi:SHS2 domain-containing protein